MRQISDFQGVESFSFWQKLMLRRFHPQSIFLDVVGMTWFIYFLWNHQWVPAVAAVLGCRILSLIFVRIGDYGEMAATLWGRLALLHLHPVNMVVQVAGMVVFLFGLWQHETEIILAGTSIVFLGHWCGWTKVHKSFAP